MWRDDVRFGGVKGGLCPGHDQGVLCVMIGREAL
jgi:hypothetical protein